METHKEEIIYGKASSTQKKWNFNWEGDEFKNVDLKKLIIYQMHIGTFFKERSDDDNNYLDIDEKLAYLKLLGVNAMELIIGPPASDLDSGMDFQNRSLAIKSEDYASLAFANLVKKAHLHSIAVFMTVNYLNLGFLDMDSWKFYDWRTNDRGKSYYKEGFRTEEGVAIPEYGHSEVRSFMKDYIFMWLEKYHCDGISIKGTDFKSYSIEGDDRGGIPEDGLSLLKEINGEIKNKYPTKILIAQNRICKNFITESIVNGGLGFDLQADSMFPDNVRFVLKQPRDEDRIMRCVVDAVAHSYSNDSFSRVVYCESYNEIANGGLRLPEEIYPGKADDPNAIKRSVLGAVITLTAPGIPLLFQGQEFVTSSLFVEGKRMDWKRLSGLQGIPQLFGNLIKLRKSDYKDYSGFQGNMLEFVHFNEQGKILAYQRSHPEHSNHQVMIIINLSYVDYEKYIIGLSFPGKWKLVFNSSSKEYGESLGSDLMVKGFAAQEDAYDGRPYRGTFTLPCYSALIFIHYAIHNPDNHNGKE